jgi:hypothetical protein
MSPSSVAFVRSASLRSAPAPSSVAFVRSAPAPCPFGSVPQEPEPTTVPIFRSLVPAESLPKALPETPKQSAEKAPQESRPPEPKIRVWDRYRWVVTRQEASRRSVWSHETTWQERVCRLALPDRFEDDRTYARLPAGLAGAACPECPPASPFGSASVPQQVVGTHADPVRGLYVVHGCTRCGQRRLLER